MNLVKITRSHLGQENQKIIRRKSSSCGFCYLVMGSKWDFLVIFHNRINNFTPFQNKKKPQVYWSLTSEKWQFDIIFYYWPLLFFYLSTRWPFFNLYFELRIRYQTVVSKFLPTRKMKRKLDFINNGQQPYHTWVTIKFLCKTDKT